MATNSKDSKLKIAEKKAPSAKSTSVRILKKTRLNLRRGEVLGTGLKSLATMQLEAAILELRGNNVFPEPIHKTRTYIKKVRSIVLLAAPLLGSERKVQLTGFLHEASIRLGQLRDSEVQVQSLDLLLETKGLTPEDYSSIRSGLADMAKQRRNNDSRQIPRVVGFLKKALGTIPEWPVEQLEGKDIRRRIRRIYRRGRTTLDLCLVDYTPELFHTFRKLVKQLWYSLRITSKFWTNEAATLIAELDAIGEAAGKERDLSMLAKTLEQGPKNKFSLRLIQAIEELLPKLRAEALSAGEHFYEAKPKSFIDGLDI